MLLFAFSMRGVKGSTYEWSCVGICNFDLVLARAIVMRQERGSHLGLE